MQVNANLAAKLLEQAERNQTNKDKMATEMHHIDSDNEEEEEDEEKKAPIDKTSLLTDSRFGKMFTSTDFEVNEDSEV